MTEGFINMDYNLRATPQAGHLGSSLNLAHFI